MQSYFFSLLAVSLLAVSEGAGHPHPFRFALKGKGGRFLFTFFQSTPLSLRDISPTAGNHPAVQGVTPHQGGDKKMAN